MKTNTHPTYHDEAEVVCACGNIFTIGSTKQKITVEVCAKCHPFFTGEMRYLDTMGRVEKFQQKQKHAKAKASDLAIKKKKKKEKQKQARHPKTLREMLLEAS